MIQLLLVACIQIGAASAEQSCPRCSWKAPKTTHLVEVRGIEQLEHALQKAAPDTTILLADGVYMLRQMLDIRTPGLVIRGRSGRAGSVILRGAGPDEKVIGVGLSVSAARTTIADLTVGNVQFHGIQVRGESGASRCVIHNVRIVDTGQQLLKGSVGEDGLGPEGGIVACSTFEYSDSASSDYTNGVDVLGGLDWVVFGNVFRRIRGPASNGHSCGPAVLFWQGSVNTRVESNMFVDCYRGIALGLVPRRDKPGRANSDHRGGVVRRNAIVNLHDWSDESIEVNDCPGALIEHNTVVAEGRVPWSISVRFPGASAVVRNNLTSRAILTRDGGKIRADHNLDVARRDWFRDTSRADLRLARPDLPAIDAATQPEPGSGDRAFSGKAPDIGAFEFRPETSPPPSSGATRP